MRRRREAAGSGSGMTGADRRKVNSDAGFSLVELLIAVVILAIIVIPLLNLFLASHRLNIKSRQTLRATTVAQDIMEGLKAYDIEELKAQFNDPAGGFYVIDDSLIRGTVMEETARESDPGLYCFSMRGLSMQGSEYDALIWVDARGYMEPLGASDHDHAFNNADMADARSIDKNNGTFVETDVIRKAVLGSVWKDEDMKDALVIDGVTQTQIDEVNFKNQDRFFDQISRSIEILLTVSSERDEDGNPMVDMSATELYQFSYIDGNGGTVLVSTKGDMGAGIWVEDMPCGVISGDEANVNIFYYPLYGSNILEEKITVRNDTGAKLNLLIAKQRYENPGDPADSAVMTDAQLMAAEMDYEVDIDIVDGHSAPLKRDKYTLKTNLGLNLAGKSYVEGEGKKVDRPQQLRVNSINMDLSGTSQLNLYTLDGVRSPMGAAPSDGEITELIYDVEISVYEGGAGDRDFPDDERMVVIEGSKNN